jgi:hypothetical protein
MWPMLYSHGGGIAGQCLISDQVTRFSLTTAWKGDDQRSQPKKSTRYNSRYPKSADDSDLRSSFTLATSSSSITQTRIHRELPNMACPYPTREKFDAPEPMVDIIDKMALDRDWYSGEEERHVVFEWDVWQTKVLSTDPQYLGLAEDF